MDEEARRSGGPAPADRRRFLRQVGRGLGAAFLAGTAGRVLLGAGRGSGQPPDRWVWWIDPNRCTFCGRCATACVRRPSAVKAVNDPKLCSNCVVCYGHIFNRNAPSDQIDLQPKVCPLDAVRRTHFSGGLEGYYLYDIRPELCNACGLCARECNRHGSKSMFLVIRPDLCLDCAECAIADDCPPGAIVRAPLGAVTDFRGPVDPPLPGTPR